MKKRLSILALVHEDLVPPESIDGLSDKEILAWKSEYDVVSTLINLGHQVNVVGVHDDLAPLREALQEHRPDIIFNLLEEFHGVADYDQHVVSYLELQRQPYTGCNPRGLTLTRDKALSKKILSYHRIPTPRFAVFPRGRRINAPARVRFPLFVKSVSEHASLGISQASVVADEASLVARVAFLHEKVGTDVIAEEYIEGRELYVGVLGNERLQTFPVWELRFTKLPEGTPRIATRKVKWDLDYQKKYGIETGVARDLPEPTAARIARLCRRIFHALNLSGYARMDLRLTPEGQIYVLEANPNPNLEYGEDFAESAEAAGIGYEALIRRIVSLGLRFRAPWMQG